MKDLTERLQSINTFVLDFDGVLSDGKVYVQSDGEQVRATNVKDGYALHYALSNGYRVAVISGGYAQSMRKRYEEFHGMEIHLRVRDKVGKLNEYMAENGLTVEQVLVVGDDIPDYPIMQMAGLSCCPNDAAEEIKAVADYVSPKNGGNGAVRDIVEMVLKAQGKWFGKDAFVW